MGFLHSSFGKESACNAGDPSSIPASGRSAVEGVGYPLQFSWASLLVQLVNNLPAMQKTWVQSLGWEDSPGGWKGYPLQYSGLEKPNSPWVTQSWTRLGDFHFTSRTSLVSHLIISFMHNNLVVYHLKFS